MVSAPDLIFASVVNHRYIIKGRVDYVDRARSKTSLLVLTFIAEQDLIVEHQC
jgi:hypothetical protein